MDFNNIPKGDLSHHIGKRTHEIFHQAQDSASDSNHIFFPQIQQTDYGVSAIQPGRDFDETSQNNNSFMNKEQASFYQNESKTLISEPPIATSLQGDSNILPHNLNHHPRNISSYPNMGYQERSNLHLEHQKHNPGPVWVDGNVYPSPPMPNLEPNLSGNIYGSEFASSEFHTRGNLDFPQISDPPTLGKHTHSRIKDPEKGLPISNNTHDTEHNYLKYVPLFTGINGTNFKDLLVKVLHECSDQVSLDDFYNLLYNFETPDQVISSPSDGFRIDKSEPNDSRIEGLNFCHFILENFRSPSADRLTQNSGQRSVISVNFPDICKNFLAIKIIFDSFKAAEDIPKSESWVSRLSVYKAYYIICHKLIQKYSSSDSSVLQSNLILNHSQIGKIFRLVFPNISAKRLGKRGDSTFHYQGVTWNDVVIEEEIKSLIDLSLPDIELKLKRSQDQRVNETGQSNRNSLCGGNEMLSPVSISNSQVPSLQLSNRKPIYSFVYLFNTFPVADCFPRSWEIIPGNVPQQSTWAKETMYKSVYALKSHNIDIEPLISKISGPVFCAESLDNFFEDVLSVIQYLMEVSASEDLYLHLYLIVSTLIFPMVFSSRKEVSSRDKLKLRTSLSNFAARLGNKSMQATSFCNLMAFVKIIKTMANISKLLSSEYKTSYTKNILRALIGDTQSDETMDGKFFEDMITREAFIACNAFNWEFVDENVRQSSMHHILQNITNSYVKLAICGSEKILKIPELMTVEDLEEPTYELSYYVFETMVEVFHTAFITHPAVLQLPMKVIGSFLNLIIKEFQNLSFRHFSNRDSELSKDLFRAWWVHSSAVQDYMELLSEIIALSSRFA